MRRIGEIYAQCGTISPPKWCALHLTGHCEVFRAETILSTHMVLGLSGILQCCKHGPDPGSTCVCSHAFGSLECVRVCSCVYEPIGVWRKRREEEEEEKGKDGKSSRSGQTEQKCGIDSALCRASTLARVCVCGSCSTKTGTLVDGQTCHGC